MAERSSFGRLDPPFTLILDDVAAVAPLPQLPDLLTTGPERALADPGPPPLPRTVPLPLAPRRTPGVNSEDRPSGSVQRSTTISGSCSSGFPSSNGYLALGEPRLPVQARSPRVLRVHDEPHPLQALPHAHSSAASNSAPLSPLPRCSSATYTPTRCPCRRCSTGIPPSPPYRPLLDHHGHRAHQGTVRRLGDELPHSARPFGRVRRPLPPVRVGTHRRHLVGVQERDVRDRIPQRGQPQRLHRGDSPARTDRTTYSPKTVPRASPDGVVLIPATVVPGYDRPHPDYRPWSDALGPSRTSFDAVRQPCTSGGLNA
ncbi:hypothetical protein SALBM217S_09087 [Streptomyces griseoloalbus]